MRRIRTATQDNGIACLEAQRTGIRSHIGAAFINDADHTERRAHTLDMEPVRTIPFGNHFAHRIRQGCDSTDTVGNRTDPAVIERQPVNERGCHAALFRIGQIKLVGFKNIATRFKHRIGGSNQRPVLLFSGSDGKRGCGSARLAAHFRHDCSNIVYRFCLGQHPISPMRLLHCWQHAQPDHCDGSSPREHHSQEFH